MTGNDSENEGIINKNDNPTEWALREAFRTFDPDDAIDILDDKFPIRRIDEELEKVLKRYSNKYGKTVEEAEKYLRKELGSQKVGNWLNGKTKNIEDINRDSIIQIAFVLKMTYEETEEFLKRCWHDGFYMRDVGDVIYRHFLKNGWDYSMATEMIKTFSDLNIYNHDPAISETFQKELNAAQKRLTDHLSTLTGKVLEKEELEKIIMGNKQFFGTFRRKAYERFKELYDNLKQEWEDIAKKDYELDSSVGLAEDPAHYTVTTEEICDAIVKAIPEMRKRNPNEIIRKLITENVPCRQDMSQIINKTVRSDSTIFEVDRKLLMLVWLASEDGFIEKFKTDNEEEDFMEHILTLNDLLKAHGMAELDARHPFDWLIMNSMRCGYILDEKKKNKWIDDIEDRMLTMFEKM